MITQLTNLLHQIKDGTFFDEEIAAWKVDKRWNWDEADFMLQEINDEMWRHFERMVFGYPDAPAGSINDIEGAPPEIKLSIPVSAALTEDLKR